MVCSAGIPSYSTYSIYFTSLHNLHLHTVPTYILNRTTHSNHFGIRINADASACASANASWRMRSPESATTVSSSGPSASAWLGVDHDGILLGAWLEVVEILPDFCQEERVILLVTDPESGHSACLWSYDPHVQHPYSGHSAFLWSREPHVQNSVRDANTPYLGHAHTPYLGHGDTSYLGHADNSRHIYILILASRSLK